MKNLIWITLLLTQVLLVKVAAGSKALPYAMLKQSAQTAYTGTNAWMSPISDVTFSLRFSTLTVKPTTKGVLLSWTVEETAQLQYFLIEHAVDGQHFSPLFEVPVQSHQHTYSFTDTEAKTKAVYYRVKAVYATEVIESPVRKLTAPTN